jgi:hypothetical protein
VFWFRDLFRGLSRRLGFHNSAAAVGSSSSASDCLTTSNRLLIHHNNSLFHPRLLPVSFASGPISTPSNPLADLVQIPPSIFCIFEKSAWVSCALFIMLLLPLRVVETFLSGLYDHVLFFLFCISNSIAFFCFVSCCLSVLPLFIFPPFSPVSADPVRWQNRVFFSF